MQKKKKSPGHLSTILNLQMMSCLDLIRRDLMFVTVSFTEKATFRGNWKLGPLLVLTETTAPSAVCNYNNK